MNTEKVTYFIKLITILLKDLREEIEKGCPETEVGSTTEEERRL